MDVDSPQLIIIKQVVDVGWQPLQYVAGRPRGIVSTGGCGRVNIERGQELIVIAINKEGVF